MRKKENRDAIAPCCSLRIALLTSCASPYRRLALLVLPGSSSHRYRLAHDGTGRCARRKRGLREEGQHVTQKAGEEMRKRVVPSSACAQKKRPMLSVSIGRFPSGGRVKYLHPYHLLCRTLPASLSLPPRQCCCLAAPCRARRNRLSGGRFSARSRVGT